LSVAPFTFSGPRQILFGRGKASELPARCTQLGQRVLLVRGKNAARTRPLLQALVAAGLQVDEVAIEHEPTIEVVTAAVGQARHCDAQVVLSIGGGSAIDAGKAIAALVANPGQPLDYLEVIGRGQKLQRPGLPFIAAPTTSGTGAEATKNAVLASLEQRVKVSLRDDSMLPTLALVDPELTLSVPPDVTAATGLDALTQVLEPYVSNQANPMTDALCVEGLTRGARSLLRVCRDGNDLDAREDLCVTSLFGGLALANAKLGAVHGFAGPVGGMFNAPHGAVCARLLPLVMQANLTALRSRAPHSDTLRRYDHVAQLLTGEPSARADDGVHWVTGLCQQLAIPGFSSYGMSGGDLASLVEKAQRSSSMKGNPIELTSAELMAIAEQAL
jgi:alcohol dehydrogenase class IV